MSWQARVHCSETAIDNIEAHLKNQQKGKGTHQDQRQTRVMQGPAVLLLPAILQPQTSPFLSHTDDDAVPF